MLTFAVILNPKTMDLVAVSADEHSDNDDITVKISYFGDRDSFIGRGYYQTHNIHRDEYGDKYPRMHAPSGVKPHGQGFGFCLYSGAALAAARDDRYEGIHSIVGNRTGDAEELWSTFLRKNYTHREGTGDRSENCDEVDDYEHCEDINDDSRWVENADGEYHDGYIQDRQVCGNVTVEVCKDEEADFLSHDSVIKTGLVLVYQRESDESIEAETTETVNADLIVRARVANVEAAVRLYEHMRRQYDRELLEAFTSRHDIMEMLFGQQRIPGVAGLGQVNIPRPTRRVPLPPLTDESAAILEKWKDIG